MKIRESARYLLLVLALLVQVTAAASSTLIKELSEFNEVGTGKLTWLGMTVYQASLFSADGQYQALLPHALKIDYQFSFSARQLAERSLKEIERIHGEQVDRDKLVERLQAVFRDVEKGEYILGVHYPGQGADFYGSGEMLGSLDNPQLARMFFDIWLDPDTREPGLRSQLLGERK